ncbi:MAG: anthranilate synthase component I family protein, partial [Actinobacteria bacterium]|nr:anthranilate synthase component I family protein [Actinomycetota bacterium]
MSSTSHPPAGEALFWGDGLVAFGLEEVRHDLAALSEPGFWAVVATFEGEYTFARFAEVEPSPTPPGAPPWIP